MTRDPALPRRVHVKAGRYYYVEASGKKRIWHTLTRVDDGLGAMFGALSALLSVSMVGDKIPALVNAWQREVGARHKPKTQANNDSRLAVIARVFAEFSAADITPPDVAQFLAGYKHQARTHNQYRALMRELMRFAEERGLRTGNPVSGVIRTVTEKPRTRYVTDSQMRRIKVGAIVGDDGKPTRSGRMIAAIIDMAYLTGQDIGMLLALRWERDPADEGAPFVGDAGLFFRRSKVAGTTGAAVLIEWTPKLRSVVDRLRAMRAERLVRTRAEQRVVCGNVFTTQSGHALTYNGFASAWKRAVQRSGVPPTMFRDLRAKALTDKETRDGMGAARDMGQHSTDGQTADYVRLRGGRKTKATR